MPVAVVCILIFLVTVIGLAVHFIVKYTPTKARMDLNEYYGQVAEGETAVILGTEIMEQKGLLAEEQQYLPLELVTKYLNQRYYWDGENQQISLCDAFGAEGSTGI